jgi:Tol biopolymer transport system component
MSARADLTMALPPGTRLGPYELLSPIGAGGMGEVYKARDTRLDRTVAVKLLRPDAEARADRQRRFEIEARAISSLHHPNICALFDVGEQAGRPFLVMEYLEGETLDDRLTRGPLAAAEVLQYGARIADALDHAHGAQIVHRDLKPSNVMLTAQGVKLLDFGLAKELAPGLGLVSTATFDPQKLTAEGSIVGTFQHMAPEQLEGRPIDARTDLFAFGVLLYEMATARKAFEGESRASLIASILTSQPPPVSVTRQSGDRLPPALDHIVERCLQKRPADRWQTARDVKLELEWAASAASSDARPSPNGGAPASGRRERVAWILAAAALVVAATLWLGRSDQPVADLTVFAIEPPPGVLIGVAQNRPRSAVSPDGRHLAFLATREGRRQIWVRSLGALDARPVDGTDGAQAPFWSPDSRFIGFFADSAGELRKVDVSGGPPRTICAAQSDGSIAWGRDGTILFTQFRDGVYRVPADGGVAARVTTVDKTKGEMNHYWPEFLPDGRHFIYMATAVDGRAMRLTPTVYVATIDGSAAPRLLAQKHSRMVYSPTGHLLFVEDSVLMAQPFDLATLQLTGEPLRIADGVGYSRTLGNGAFSLSETGVLAYQGNQESFQLLWYDRRGAVTDPGWSPQSFGSVRLSPDAGRLVVDVGDPRTGGSDLWLYDVQRGAPIRYTTDGFASNAVWSPDAGRLAFRSGRSQAPAVVVATLDGRDEVLADTNSPLTPEDWSPDGALIAYTNSTRTTGADLWLLPTTKPRQPRPLLQTPANEWDAKFSPDSAWIAFTSNELGSPDVYVVRVDGRARTRISVGGGSSPRWRRDGKELYYLAADNRTLVAVSVETGVAFTAGASQRLFTMRSDAVSRVGLRYAGYDATADGQRFLFSVPAGAPTTSRLTIVQNWAAALRR